MHTPHASQSSPASGIADDLAALFVRLGLEAVIRDPETVDVIAATPHAESRVLAAQPGQVTVVSARIAGAQLRVELLPPDPKPAELTGRQQQVADCLAKGMRNQQIADALGISLHTVRRHLEQMFRRLGVNNRRDAIVVLRSGRKPR